MEDLLQILLLLAVIGILIALPYFVLKYLIKLFSSRIGKVLPNWLILTLSLGLSLVIFTYLFVYTLAIKPGAPISDGIQDEYKIHGLEGKILLNAPDTLKIFSKERVTVRIAKTNIKDSVFVERIKNYRPEKAIVDKIKLSTVMTVNLKESPKENRISINMLNNNETQVIDTTKYSEWLFDIKPIDYGKINLVVSVSAVIKTEYGNQEIDHPVYEKEIEIYASTKDKVLVFWEKQYWIVLAGIALFFLLLFKLIPNQSIIEVHMANSNQTNFWNAGSLGLVIYIITIASIGVFKMLEISLYFVPLVFIGTILIYAIFTAVSLRDNDKLSEENFLKLMGIAIKKIPPLNWIFKDSTPSA